TTVLSILLFLITFVSTWQSYQNEESIRVAQLERNWSNTIDAFGNFLNVLSSQPRLFQDEKCILKLLENVYKNYSSLITYPSFGRADGKMFSYPSYDYGPEYDPRQRPWYQAAVQSPQDYVFVKPFVHAILKEPAMAVAKAVLDENGNILGVLACDLVASSVAQSLLVENSYILDESG
ncbi:cache domain-containing protein, partial [Pseudothermotoga sp.]|uniref:cache domain-containing protein n=1 Tax=Pseudothermotoga sp. TaxID=2033661 RepID=UPI0031F60B95